MILCRSRHLRRGDEARLACSTLRGAKSAGCDVFVWFSDVFVWYGDVFVWYSRLSVMFDATVVVGWP